MENSLQTAGRWERTLMQWVFVFGLLIGFILGLFSERAIMSHQLTRCLQWRATNYYTPQPE